MKYLICLSLIFLCFSQLKCQEVEDNEDFETEEVDPVDTNVEEEEDEEESESAPDLDLIPSFKSPPTKRKGKKTDDPDSGGESVETQDGPFTSIVSKVEKGTVGILGKLSERFASRVQEVGSHLQETQQRLNKRLQNKVTDFMEEIQHQIEG